MRIGRSSEITRALVPSIGASLSAAHVLAEDHYVAVGESVAAAVALANDGDRVILAPGIHVVGADAQIVIDAKSIHLLGESPMYPSSIYIEPGMTAPCIATSGDTSGTIIEQIRFNGGSRGIEVGSAATLDVVACWFQDFTRTAVLVLGTARVSDCVFHSNASAHLEFGPAITNRGRLTADRCVFFDNAASDQYPQGGGTPVSGGAVVMAGEGRIERSTFSENFAEAGGAAIWFPAGHGLSFVEQCRFRGNTTTGTGGALLIDAYDSQSSDSVRVSSCEFIDNVALTGGAVAIRFSTIELVNCTVAWNSSLLFGGAISAIASDVLIANSVLWENSTVAAAEPGHGVDATASDLQVHQCCLDGGWPGATNISDDPLFVEPGESGRVDSHSPCINAGNSFWLPASSSFDLDGRARVSGIAVDMGAYEYPQPKPCFGDIDGDFSISFSDLNELLDNWATLSKTGDLDGDGFVTFLDLEILLGLWGTTCGASSFEMAATWVLIPSSCDGNADGLPDLEDFRTADLYLRSNMPFQALSVVSGSVIGQNPGIRVSSGSFYQHPSGSNTEPSDSQIDAAPCLAFDSWLAIGHAEPAFLFEPSADDWGPVLQTLWFVAGDPVDATQDQPIADGGYYVRIARLTVPATSTVDGGVEVGIRVEGETSSKTVNLSLPIW